LLDHTRAIFIADESAHAFGQRRSPTSSPIRPDRLLPPVNVCADVTNLRLRNFDGARTTLFEWAPAVLYIALLYFQPLTRYLLSREVGELANAGVLLVGVFNAVTRVRIRSKFHPLAAAIVGALFVCLVMLSGLFNQVPGYALALSLYRIISACLAFILLAATARSRTGIWAICSTLAICAAINAGVALWGAATHQTLFGVTTNEVGPAAFGYDRTLGRSGGVWGDNYCGIFNLPGILAALALAYHRKYILLAFGMLAIGMAGTVVSFSRGSILSAAVGTCAFLVLGMGKLSPSRVFGMILLLVTAVGIGVASSSYFLRLLPRDLQAYTADRFSEKGVASDGRNALYKHYIEEAGEHPLMGSGPGHILAEVGYDISKNNINKGYGFPHNSFLDVAVEFGIPGLCLFALAILSPLADIRAARADVHIAHLYACYVGVLISSMTVSIPYMPFLWGLAGAIVGAAHTRAGRGVQAIGFRQAG
jgi:hypothetical protein